MLTLVLACMGWQLKARVWFYKVCKCGKVLCLQLRTIVSHLKSLELLTCFSTMFRISLHVNLLVVNKLRSHEIMLATTLMPAEWLSEYASYNNQGWLIERYKELCSHCVWTHNSYWGTSRKFWLRMITWWCEPTTEIIIIIKSIRSTTCKNTLNKSCMSGPFHYGRSYTNLTFCNYCYHLQISVLISFFLDDRALSDWSMQNRWIQYDIVKANILNTFSPSKKNMLWYYDL